MISNKVCVCLCVCFVGASQGKVSRLNMEGKRMNMMYFIGINRTLLLMNEWTEKHQSFSSSPLSSTSFSISTSVHLFHSLGCSPVTAAQGFDNFAESQFCLRWCVYLGAVKLTFSFFFFHTRDENPPVVMPGEHQGGKVHKDPVGKTSRCFWVSPLNLFHGIDKVQVQKQFFKLLQHCRTAVFVFSKYKKNISQDLPRGEKKMQHNDANH